MTHSDRYPSLNPEPPRTRPTRTRRGNVVASLIILCSAILMVAAMIAAVVIR